MLLTVLAIALAGSAPSSSHAPAAPDASASAKVAAAAPVSALDPNEVVCRTLSKTGSRVSRTKVCMTREKWLESQQEAKDYTRRVQKVQGATNGN